MANLANSFCSQNAEGMGADDLLCSRNARSRTFLFIFGNLLKSGALSH
jgi:hypothetical protein